MPEDQEPPFSTAWVFGRSRQRKLLEQFFEPIVPKRSLVFYYTKEGQPIADDITRLIVGVGSVTKVDQTLEYDSVGSKAGPPIWEHIVHHSIRTGGADGFLLPYHEYLEPTGSDQEDLRRRDLLREIAVTPDPEHRHAFSYFSEHAAADIALSTLVRCLDAVRAIRRHGIADGPWADREDWLNEQVARAGRPDLAGPRCVSRPRLSARSARPTPGYRAVTRAHRIRSARQRQGSVAGRGRGPPRRGSAPAGGV